MRTSFFNQVKHLKPFSQGIFDLQNESLTFHGVDLDLLIEKYGTPFKLIYLPHIKGQIAKARRLFQKAIQKHDYKGNYHYCYCTKCCHYAPVIKSTLKENVQLETSSSVDVDIIYKLLVSGDLDKSITIIHNGYKTHEYLQRIIKLNIDGFENSILILDSIEELTTLKEMIGDLPAPMKIGVRMATDSSDSSAYTTSRLGIAPSEIIEFCKSEIINDASFQLVMVHFFVDSGINDNAFYWNEFNKALDIFTALEKLTKSHISLNLGGGFPVRNTLTFDYDFEGIVDEVVRKIKNKCKQDNVAEPDIYTEFGRYTVGESGAVILSVLEQKRQNNSELWYLVDNSIMNTIPDAWSISEKFILLPINKWQEECLPVHIGGISCDQSDFYNLKDLGQNIYLPKIDKNEKPLYIGFFNTGAYQDAISGYGGTKHCLISTPQIIVVDEDDDGGLIDFVFKQKQSLDESLNDLGY